MTELEELQKQLNDIREAIQRLTPGSRVHQRLSEEQAALEAKLTVSGAIAQGDRATAIGEDGIGVGGSIEGTLIKGEQNQVFHNSTVILAGDGARILVSEHSKEQNSKPNVQAVASFAPTATSILTFLFTDIEGSTQLWENYPEAMKTALARHDAILREAIENHKGKVFKTVGDAFYTVFPNARNALKAAIAAQRTLHAEAWGETVIKVRMALHTGAVEARDGDYFGQPLNRVARLLSAGHGGQVLLSTTFAELVRSNLPPDINLRDMGERRLKDLNRPEHIYQLLTFDLPTDFPPLKTLETIRTNLPAQLTSFIGRAKEITAVKKLISNSRLTSLTGSGGAGKTRLSLQVAADLLDSFPSGVWFVELAPLSDPALIPQIVAGALGLHDESGRPSLEMLTSYLSAKTALLILDNCEHVIEAAAQFAETLLQSCPHLRLLVSSREALGIPGEAAYRVPSLSTPNPRIPLPLADLASLESVRLFVERAQAVSADFALSQENAPAIAQVCTRLDGIPLAIELAAARVKMLRVEQIAERLDDRFRLLTGGSRTALHRHQTLRAMIDWSYDLLPESERALLRRLSVFAGGWTLEAAETVCQGPGIDDYNVFDPLSQLVNKSLVTADADDTDETRYHLLETVRQYAREKLNEAGEGIIVRDAHLQYFLGLAERAEPKLLGSTLKEWLSKLELEIDNIHTAFEWSLKSDAQAGLYLIDTLFEFWINNGHVDIIINWLPRLLAKPESQAHTKMRVRGLLYQIRLGLIPIEQIEKNQDEALSIARKLNDLNGIALSLNYMADTEKKPEKIQALRSESLSIFRALGNKAGMASVLFSMGDLWGPMRNDPKVQTYLDEAMVLSREIGHVRIITLILFKLGHLAFSREDHATAKAFFNESLTILNQFKNNRTSSLVLHMMGRLAFLEGNYTQADIYYEDSLFRSEQTLTPNEWARIGLAYLSLKRGDLTRARTLFNQSQLGFKKRADTIGVVYALEGWASLAILQNQPEPAMRLFAWADATRETFNYPRPLNEQTEVDRNLATIRAHLDEAAFAEAQTTGRAMSMDEAIALALASTHD